MKEHIEIRQPIVQGLFYPEDPKALKNKIENLMDNNISEKFDGDSLILPHGGWDFTGDYIAKGFNSLPDKNFKRVIIISNVHREFDNTITLPEARYFLIGDKKIKVDLDAIKTIMKEGKKVVKSNIPHMEEHGIETVLPFVQNLYPEAKIVPILLGKTIVSLVRNLSNIITSIKNEDTLVIVTSNFSEYIKEDRSKEIGELGTSLVSTGKLSELIELTRTNKLQTCGAGAIASLILPGDYNEIKLLKAGVSEQTPLSSGKAAYYATFIFNKGRE